MGVSEVAKGFYIKFWSWFTDSLDRHFSRLLQDFVRRPEIARLIEDIAKLRVEVEELKQNQISFEKEFYTVKELAEILNVSPSCVRKKYIHTGVIEAHTPDGSKGYVVSAAEFKRVVELVETKGTWVLTA